MLNSRAHTGAPSSALLVFRGWQYTTANTHTLTHRTFERERERKRRVLTISWGEEKQNLKLKEKHTNYISVAAEGNNIENWAEGGLFSSLFDI